MEATTQQRGVREIFGEHHRKLERMFEEVLETLRAGDVREAARQWSALDRELDQHMALEEREMLPQLAASERAAVEQIRAEHAEIRARVAELGAAVDLHRITEAQAKALFDRLRAHAANEDALLYRRADLFRDRGSLLERLLHLGDRRRSAQSPPEQGGA